MEKIFNGSDYNPKLDNHRLEPQHETIRKLMLDGEWRTLFEIEDITDYPTPSISAQLRHLRKTKFGAYVVEKRSRGNRKDGLYEYRVLPSNGQKPKKRNAYEDFIMKKGLWDEYIEYKTKGEL